jgi:anti-sigma regulatory factor (Ser/Thr protein kinase)
MIMNFDNEARLTANIDALDTLLDWIAERLEENTCPHKIQNQIAVVTEELFVNICHYAYGGSAGEAVIRFACHNRTIFMQFEDSGIAFDPLTHEGPDIEAGIDDRPIGGLGIYIAKKWMDWVGYERANGKNILTVTRSIPQ